MKKIDPNVQQLTKELSNVCEGRNIAYVFHSSLHLVMATLDTIDDPHFLEITAKNFRLIAEQLDSQVALSRLSSSVFH